jgi:hypothetical protein
MRDRRCFVQFIHPGGEHRPDAGDIKRWNVGNHQRKFLKRPGRYVVGGDEHKGDLVFWGEWEPESRVLTRWQPDAPDKPRYLWEPYFEDHKDGRSRQNTDPWVYGDRFQYTGCLQHTRFGPTQLRYLSRGSVVLFGSCVGKSHFVIDTVFVVDDWTHHQEDDWQQQLDGRVSETYRMVTLERWYSGRLPEGQSHRLYFGATPQKPVGEMFSFFPCRPYTEMEDGFARPTIRMPGYVTPNLNQGKKFTHDLGIDEMTRLWRTVVQQVQDQGLALGVHAQTPRMHTLSRFLAPPPVVIPPDASEAERLLLRFPVVPPPPGSRAREAWDRLGLNVAGSPSRQDSSDS